MCALNLSYEDTEEQFGQWTSSFYEIRRIDNIMPFIGKKIVHQGHMLNEFQDLLPTLPWFHSRIDETSPDNSATQRIPLWGESSAKDRGFTIGPLINKAKLKIGSMKNNNSYFF